VHGIKEGLRAAERQFSLKKEIKLRGPAGLFKDKQHHQFCWTLLENCNKNISTCPIDIITFHRKGNGNGAEEIIEETASLLREFSEKIPNLSHLKYSNSEADPIKKWSEPRDFQSDTRYAVIVVETIFQYWKNIFKGDMSNLESISHDNGFLNFYPHIFTQRTLLARIQVNNTLPKYTQFISKPVFSALGLVAFSGPFASNVFSAENISYIITRNNDSEIFYSCIIIASHVDLKRFNNKTKTHEIEVKNIPDVDDLWYFVEGIDNKRTNPSKVFEYYGKPAFPEVKVLEAMRRSQHPVILEQPSKVVNGKIFLNVQLMEPYVIAIRICSKNISIPKKVNNLRIRKINQQEIIIFWSDALYRSR
jgi:L-iduronidase